LALAYRAWQPGGASPASVGMILDVTSQPMEASHKSRMAGVNHGCDSMLRALPEKTLDGRQPQM
jgi:hypothetical protein